MHQPPHLKYTLRRLVTKWNAYGTFWGTIFSILVNFRGAPVLIHELFSILVNFRGAPVKKDTLYVLP